MGLRNSKKSVDIASSTGSPKKNGTEPTEVKVKELKDGAATATEQTAELIEEVAEKVANMQLEGAKEDGEAPKANGDGPKAASDGDGEAQTEKTTEATTGVSKA